MDTKAEIAAIRKALRVRGLKASIRNGRGTAYGYVEMTGTEDFGRFTDSDNAVLRDAFGEDAGRSNFFLIAPNRERSNVSLTRERALGLLGIEGS